MSEHDNANVVVGMEELLNDVDDGDVEGADRQTELHDEEVDEGTDEVVDATEVSETSEELADSEDSDVENGRELRAEIEALRIQNRELRVERDRRIAEIKSEYNGKIDTNRTAIQTLESKVQKVPGGRGAARPWGEGSAKMTEACLSYLKSVGGKAHVKDIVSGVTAHGIVRTDEITDEMLRNAVGTALASMKRGSNPKVTQPEGERGVYALIDSESEAE